MGFMDQVNQSPARIPAALPLTVPDLLDQSEPPALRVNWLFSGVVLGAAGWLLVLSVIFAIAGSWIASGALLAAFALCLVSLRRAQRQLHSVS